MSILYKYSATNNCCPAKRLLTVAISGRRSGGGAGTGWSSIS